MKRTLASIILALIICTGASAAQYGLTFHQVQVVDDEGRPVTGITSVSIYLPDSTTNATIYATGNKNLPITQPMTTSSTNTTLVNGRFDWWGPDGWDYSVTDGTIVVTSALESTLTSSTGEIIFVAKNVSGARIIADNTPADEDILTYESTGTFGLAWHTPAELITAGDNLEWTGSTLNAVDILSAAAISRMEVEGTAKSNLDILKLSNSVNAADMDGTETSLLFEQWYYDAVTPARVLSGRITVGTETDWTVAGATQDSYMAFETGLNGTLTEWYRLASDGAETLAGPSTTVPDDYWAGIGAALERIIFDADEDDIELLGADVIMNKTGGALPGSVHAETRLLVVSSATAADDVQLSLIAGNAGESAVWFGDTDDEDAGRLDYYHATDVMVLRAGTSDTVWVNSTGLGVGNAPTEILDIATAATPSPTLITHYDSGNSSSVVLELRKSASDTLGALTTTGDGDILGVIDFKGVNAAGTPAWDLGARIFVTQEGPADSGDVPANMVLDTWSTAGRNTNQLKLNTDGTVSGSLLNDQWSYQMAAETHHQLADPLAIWAWITPATTEQDLTAENHDATYQNIEAADQTFEAMVWSLELGGTDEYLTVADHADLSFLTGGNDADMSIGGWVEVYADGNIKTIMAKYDDTNSQIEWEFFIDADEKVNLRFYDESAGATAYEGRITDSAVAVGWHLIVATYDNAQQGENASDGMEISVDGVDVASSASDGAGVYVDKEDLGQDVWIGAQGDNDTYGNGWVGELGALLLEQSTLTDVVEWEMYLATRGYYGQ